MIRLLHRTAVGACLPSLEYKKETYQQFRVYWRPLIDRDGWQSFRNVAH